MFVKIWIWIMPLGTLNETKAHHKTPQWNLECLIFLYIAQKIPQNKKECSKFQPKIALPLKGVSAFKVAHSGGGEVFHVSYATGLVRELLSDCQSGQSPGCMLVMPTAQAAGGFGCSLLSGHWLYLPIPLQHLTVPTLPASHCPLPGHCKSREDPAVGESLSIPLVKYKIGYPINSVENS